MGAPFPSAGAGDPHRAQEDRHASGIVCQRLRAEPMQPEIDFPSDLRALEHEYELIREIGQGGMAAVYLARHRSTGRLVAIKAIRARYLDDPDALERFAREARTVADLNHPNIVRTEAIEQIGDRAVAIIMEYVPGGTVRDRLHEYGPFSAEHAEAMLRDVASALRYAHQRRIVHRDVKPENVFLEEQTGRALLSDFGIARRIEGEAPITLLGAALGTPQYMSPEQIDGRRVDGRSDIYSLGVLGWELLTGRRPWAGENLYGIIYKQKHEELPRITSLRPRVPANLLFAIEGALVKDREKRWQSIDDFLEHLTYDPPPVLSQEYPAGLTPSDADPTLRFRRPVPSSPADSDAGAVPTAVAAPNAGEAVDGRARPVARDMPNTGATRRARERPAARRDSARIRPPAFTRRRVLLGLALFVPLLIAAGSWYVLLGGPSDLSRLDRSSDLTTSAGTIALDTTRRSDRDTGTRAIPPPVRATQPDAKAVTPPVERQPPPSVGRAADSAATQPKTAPAPRVARRDSAAPGRPSPRCGIASMADQRACLLAYIALNDTLLQRGYDSLIVELRRLAGVRRGAPDPPAVTRLRVEQRAWVVARDRECTRQPAPGSVPYWAQPLADCFARVSAAREKEIGERLELARQQPR